VLKKKKKKHMSCNFFNDQNLISSFHEKKRERERERESETRFGPLKKL
jgi:hypothetical protein